MSRLLTILSLTLPAAAVSAQDVAYEATIQPLLKKHCVACHGPTKQESSLRVDSAASLRSGGDWGEPAVVPGKPEASFLLSVVSGSNPDLRMPPEGPGLDKSDIELLRRWIAQGARMPEGATAPGRTDHWSFQPVRRPEGLAPHHNPIDQLAERRLNAASLALSPSADPRTLVRRLHLVMHGLPPTPAEIDEFLNATGSDRWAELVDRVLASPRYGERWGQHWLDIVRFGETHGFETNRERPDAWPYRDWVIESFNQDRPWDDFVRQQIAGDAMGEPIATGFLVAGPYDLVKGQDPALSLMQRQDELADIINTAGTAFLGLTVGCARCHNHKFDPITQKDYYAVQAVFAGVQHASRPIPLTDGAAEKLAETTRQIRETRGELIDYIAPSVDRFVLIDDARLVGAGLRGIERLSPQRGFGNHPAGASRGGVDDPGTRTRGGNLGAGRYTWFTNTEGDDVAAFRAALRGRYRIYVSWGCGFSTHSQDAQYVLDADGDPRTKGDQRLLATVNQQRFADGTEAPQYVWSGFHDCGVHELTGSAAVLLRGGATGTAITADAVLFERADAGEVARPPARPVNSRRNVEFFDPISASGVRFTIEATNSSQPCLDELEVFSGDVNVALASAGAVATSSSNLPGYKIHQLEHINDGRFGNEFSWISNEAGGGWVEVQFSRPVKIDRAVWGRDRNGRYSDRVATRYRIEARTEDGWVTIASSEPRLNPASESEATYDFELGSSERRSMGRELKARLDRLLARREKLEQSRSVYAGTFAQPGPTHRLYRGEPAQRREVVAPDAIASLGRLQLGNDAPERDRRMAFAKWATNPDNPLTARVIANRVWQFHFGTGLVDTPGDFGANGAAPSHPELLDWLATELMDNGWSLKHLHRRILTSRTWRQSARPRPDGLRVDAGSRLLWRFPPRRLEAEAIRDSMLAVSGVLDLTMGGPGFSGFEVQRENVRHYFPKKTYGAEDWRRMVYMTKVRQERESVFGVFDCPDASQAQPRRSRSTTPLQALNLLNSTFTMQQSELMAGRLRDRAPAVDEQVDYAFGLCFGRAPSERELGVSRSVIADLGLTQFCRVLLNTNEFLFVP